jgi:hypothetical protein
LCYVLLFYFLDSFRIMLSNGFSRELISKITLTGAIFWLGPLHIFLSLLGLKKIELRLLILILAFSAVILPSAINSSFKEGADRGTGMLRGLWYFFPIISVLAVKGIKTLFSSNIAEGVKMSFFSIIFLIFFLTPVLGNLVFIPRISETPQEVEAITYLGSKSPESLVLAHNIRERIEVYGNLTNIETRRLWDRKIRSEIRQNSRIIYTQDSTEPITFLQSLGLEYIIDSPRNQKTFGVKTPNRYSDKTNRIYASGEIQIYSLNSDRN